MHLTRSSESEIKTSRASAVESRYRRILLVAVLMQVITALSGLLLICDSLNRTVMGSASNAIDMALGALLIIGSVLLFVSDWKRLNHLKPTKRHATTQ